MAQGLWQPGSKTRYDRFSLVRDILPVAARMTGAAPLVREPSALPRQIARNGNLDRHEDVAADEVEPAPHGQSLVAQATQRVLTRDSANPPSHFVFSFGDDDGGDDEGEVDVEEPAVPAGATSSTRSPAGASGPRRSARCVSSSSSL